MGNIWEKIVSHIVKNATKNFLESSVPTAIVTLVEKFYKLEIIIIFILPAPGVLNAEIHLAMAKKCICRVVQVSNSFRSLLFYYWQYKRYQVLFNLEKWFSSYHNKTCFPTKLCYMKQNIFCLPDIGTSAQSVYSNIRDIVINYTLEGNIIVLSFHITVRKMTDFRTVRSMVEWSKMSVKGFSIGTQKVCPFGNHHVRSVKLKYRLVASICDKFIHGKISSESSCLGN